MKQKNIAIAGASGFIGQKLAQEILTKTPHRIVRLSRSPNRVSGDRSETRAVDFFSLISAEQSLQDCEVGIYLLHSMKPSNRLSQGSFSDFDFILADNFARAAAKHGLKHIVYVSGLLDEQEEKLSSHLRSRLEVEHVLASTGIPVTTLRCSLVIGPGGSSFEILRKLVDRLPSMLLPSWCQTPCQPVALDDLVEVLVRLIDYPASVSRVYDVASPEVHTYRSLIEKTVKAMGLQRALIDLPYVPVGLSRLWVRLVSGASKSLVYPLVDSLKHPMIVNPKYELPDELRPDYMSISEALSNTLAAMKKNGLTEQKGTIIHRQTSPKVIAESLVKSVQRLKTDPKDDAITVAKLYFRWLTGFFTHILSAKRVGERVDFRLVGLPAALLELTLSSDRSSPGRQLFYITGGLLAFPRHNARLEFRMHRACPDGTVFAAIHDFRPSLPWWIYRLTQAPFHRFVMWRFGAFLSRRRRFKEEKRRNRLQNNASLASSNSNISEA